MILEKIFDMDQCALRTVRTKPVQPILANSVPGFCIVDQFAELLSIFELPNAFLPEFVSVHLTLEAVFIAQHAKPKLIIRTVLHLSVPIDASVLVRA